MTLIAVAVFSAIALAMAVTTAVDRLAIANHHDAVALANAADAALNLAIRDLNPVPNWSAVLDGTVRSAFVDGAPGGSRVVPSGQPIDLTILTNRLTCGRDTACSDARIAVSTIDRPWGVNNPRWQLFAFGELPSNGPLARPNPYVTVWIGDDAGETDGNRLVDGGGAFGEGRHVVRARATAFGPHGGRATIEATFLRRCVVEDDNEWCEPGIRVQSWRVVAGQLP